MKYYKRIPLANLHNFRDLGGYGCADNGVIRFHQVYRSDSLHHLTDEGWKNIEKMGIRTIIDLRSKSEQTQMSYQAPASIEVFSLPMQEDDININDIKSTLAAAQKSFGKSLTEGYIKTVVKGELRIANILNTLSRQLSKGAVMYHCTAGKDRTGILSAFIYFLCGVAKEDIVADYQVSATYNSKNAAITFVLPPELISFAGSDPKNMKETLDHFEKADVVSALYAKGLAPESVKYLKSVLIEY